MPKERILVVDDEEDISELVRYHLDKEGLAVTCLGTGEAALKYIGEHLPDLVVLDLMLPGMDGLEVCRAMKREGRTRTIPIIILSAKGEESDVVTGLELGADDYLAKPFSPKVLVARVRNVLRRSQSQPVDKSASVHVEGLDIDPARFEVRCNGSLVEMTSTEFRIIHFLAQRPGLVFTRSQIVTAVHGDDYPVTDRSIDVQIVNLRRKLGSFGEYIETVRGVGYRFRG
ncbi:MAG: response regulator transcription factor [Bdellovibrionota bacterium]|nr:MAG: response regulator transcription factor [Bdellovibrionota bacterium]